MLGFGTHPSRGLRKGAIINIDATVDAIQHAVREAELMAGCQVDRVYAGIAGGHIEGLNGHGVVAVKDREVRATDIARVIDAAHTTPLGAEREVIHILPQEYVLDRQDGIREPLGMSGARLEARVHIVTGAHASAQNIVKCAGRCGLEVVDLVLEQLASSEAVLSVDERELGVALVDIGGGTTDIAVWSDGSIVHSAVLTLGGDHVTADLAVGLRTPSEQAEALKRSHGCAMAALVGKDEVVQVPSVGGRAPRAIERALLAEIIEPRLEEIFALVQAELRRTGYEELLASGVVLTGGSTLLQGMPQLAEDVLGLPVRRGVPTGVGGLHQLVAGPAHATCVGLLKYGRTHEQHPYFSGRERNAYARVKDRVKTWLGDIF